MPKIISSRDQLLIYVAGHIPYKFLARAMSEGEVENLGSFTVKGNSGWVIRVQAIAAKKDFYIGVSASDGKYRIIVTDIMPGWKYWVGDISEHKLYRGDNPDKYIELRRKEIENGKTKDN